MPTLGEKFGISLEIVNGKLTMLKDGTFKKTLRLEENFISTRRIEFMNESFTSMLMDPNDPTLSTANRFVNLSTGIQKKIFSQNFEIGVRKIELIQGIELGQALIRFSYNLERPMKWQIKIPFEKHEVLKNSIVLPQNIDIFIQTTILIKFGDDLLIFNIPEGFTQIILFVKSQLPYSRIAKNLLLITKGDKSKDNIIAMGLNEQFYPIITYVYLQDFKNKISRFQDLNQIGSILALKKQYSEAINYLNKALNTVRAIGDQSKEAEILINLATAESDFGDYKAAAKNFNYALKIIEEHQIESLRFGCLISLSKNLKKLKHFQKALDYQYMILEEVRASGDLLVEAEILIDISDSLVGIGHPEEAIEYQQAAIDLRRRINDTAGEANNLMMFGELLITLARTAEAMSCYEQALRLKRELGDARGVANCLKSMGRSFYNLGKYEKAKEYYKKAKIAFQNQALVLDIQQINTMLDKMKERPYFECKICKYKCNSIIIGLAHSDVVKSIFITKFKNAIQESLSLKNIDKLVDQLKETALENSEIKSNDMSEDHYVFCLLIQAINIHLAQLNAEQKKQIVKMVQDNIKKRKYNSL